MSDSLRICTSNVAEVAKDVEQNFGGLTPEQLNWKPGADRWSIGQCLDHLVVTNSMESVAIEKALNGEHTKTFWERLPVWPALMGNLTIRMIHPKNVRRFPAPKNFRPTSSDVSGDIVQRYLDLSANVREFMKNAEGMDLKSMIITSPIKPVTYSLYDAFKIIGLHDRRHFNQAMRVIETEGFPRT